MKILIADGNPIHLLIATSFVQELGFECRAVDNGREAQRIILNEYFDLVFLNLNLPDKDAIQIINEIRYVNLYYLRKLPVIVMSSDVELSNKELSMLGFNGFLRKPFSYDKLKSLCMKYWKCKLNTLEKDGLRNYVIDPESIKKLSSSAALTMKYDHLLNSEYGIAKSEHTNGKAN